MLLYLLVAAEIPTIDFAAVLKFMLLSLQIGTASLVPMQLHASANMFLPFALAVVTGGVGTAVVPGVVGTAVVTGVVVTAVVTGVVGTAVVTGVVVSNCCCC